jgi:uncharacterized protein HemX
MSHHDEHGPPVPPEGTAEEEVQAGVCQIGLVHNHTHEHTGWKRWAPLAWYALIIVLGVWGFFVVDATAEEAHEATAQAQALAESNKQILENQAVTSEANCMTRNEQLKRAAASAAASQKFLEDVGKKLAIDGNPETAKFVEDEIKKRRVAAASTQPPAAIDCTQFRRALGLPPAPTTTTTTTRPG